MKLSKIIAVAGLVVLAALGTTSCQSKKAKEAAERAAAEAAAKEAAERAAAEAAATPWGSPWPRSTVRTPAAPCR